MKILGIDYGRSKVGIAIGETMLKLVEPLQVLTISNLKSPASTAKLGEQISKIIKENKVEKIIIGLPNGEMDKEVRKFGEELEKETNLPVEYFDETLSTQDAQKILIYNDRKRKTRKEKEDAVAAAIMLEYYLETHLC